MANPNKQWTAEDIEKIWNNNGAQKKTAPLPSLNSTSYKFKPYEDKEYTAEDIEKVWKGVERGKQITKEMKAKATSAPAKNTRVPDSISEKTKKQQEISRRELAKEAQSMAMANDRMASNKRDLSTRPSTKYSNQTAGQTKSQSNRDTKYDNDFAEYWEYTREKGDFNDYDAATDSAIPHWQNVKKNIMQKNNWSEKEFKEHWKEYEQSRSTEEANAEVESMVNLAKEHPVLGSIAQQAYLPQTAIEGASTLAGGLLGGLNSDLLASSSDDPRFTGTRVREATKQAVRDNLKTDFGRGAYDVVGSLVDMGENMALSGGNPLLMGLNTGAQSATRNQMTALERGTDATSAADYGSTAGILSGVMNSIGLDKALGAEASTALGRMGKSALTEGLENVVEDVGNLGLDALSNKNFSQLQTLHDYYVGQGMDDKDAWGQVAKDTGVDLVKSGISGALFGGLISGVKNLPELTSEIKGGIGNISDRARSLPVLNKITGEDVNNSSINDVDNVLSEQYNNVTGGNANGETADVGTENQGSVRPEESISTGAEIGGNVDEKRTYTAKDGRTIGIRDVVDERTSKLMDDAGINNFNLRNTTGKTVDFSQQLQRAKEANVNGRMVDSKTPEQLTDSKLFSDDAGTCGVAVESDGNIVGVHKHPSNEEHGAVDDLLITARENGGDRLDCYGIGLVNKYEPDGFIPVARVEWNEKFKPDDWGDNPPEEIFFMMKDNRTTEQVLQDRIKGESHLSDLSELESLPYFTIAEYGDDAYNAAKEYRDKLLEQPNEVASSLLESQNELADYTARRDALIEAQKGINMQDMIANLNQLKAMDAEMAETHPEWFRDGKFVGDEATYDFSNEMDESSAETPTEEITTDDVNNSDYNKLKMDLQFFGKLNEEKKRLKVQLTEKGISLRQRKAINDQINDIDQQLTGLRKTITNTAVKAGIVTPEQIANDPELNSIATYVKHSNAKTVENARQNLAQNGEQIKNDYISGKTKIKTDQDVDQAMQLLQGERGELDNYERNSILKNLATNGTEAGQFIQAFAKYSNTKEGALISATKVMSDETEHWVSRNRTAKEHNNRIATALRKMGYDGSMEVEKIPMTREELKKSIVRTIEKEVGSIEGKFDDSDIEFLADLAEDKSIPIWQITDEIEHKLQHGEWYELTQETPEPRQPMNGKLLTALNALVDEEVRQKKPDKTFEQLREEVRNTLDNETASFNSHKNGDVNVEFTDSDVDYIAHMIEHNASVADITDALNTKLATGRFGISDETQAEVNRLFEEAKDFDENSQDYVERQAEAFRLLAEEVAPNATPLEKFDAWRYMAMLGNPKTMLRNLIGNKMFGAVTGVADNFAALVESGADASIKGGKKLSNKVLNTDYDETKGIQRTKAVLNPVKDKALLDATLNDAYAKRFRQIEGSKYEKMDKDALSRNRSVFNSKLMRLTEKAVDKGISDTKAVAKKYSTSMAGYMKANGITEQDLKDSYEFDRLNRSKSLLSKEEIARLEDLRETAERVDKARDYALKQAEYATFHEDNAIADILGSASRKNMGLRVLVEGLVPFKKTPANIVKSGVEFSPLGAVKSIAQTGKLIYENTGSRKTNLGDTYSVKNPLTQAYKDVDRTLASDIIQSWGRTLTGSALASLGYYLYNKGILHSSSKDEKYQDDLEGKQNYSIEINGKTYSIDWAVPAAMPLLLGAEVKKAFEENAILDEKWYESPDRMFSTLSALFEPVIETSMLQGIENTLSQLTNRYNNSSSFEKAANAAASLGTGYLSQAIPTLSGQIARTIDNTRRSTDTNSEGLLLPSLEKQGRKIMNKIPFASRLNNPYVNARGEQQNNAPYENPLARLGYQTLSPWYAQKIDERPSDEIARDAYNGLGENGKPIRNADVFADWKSNVKLNGEKLNADEMYTYRTASGQANTEARESLANEDWFNNASPEIQTEVLRSLNTMADHIGKNAVDPNYASENDYFEAYKSGGNSALLDTIKADVEKKIQKKKLDTVGLPSNDVTKSLIDKNDKVGQQRYKQALDIAKNYGYDTISKEEYQIYDKKGAVELSQQLKYKKAAEELDVPNSEAFREAQNSGKAKAYAQAYKAISSTKVGEDDLGNDKFLSYDNTTAKIYQDKQQAGLNEYVMLKKNIPDGDSSDKAFMNALSKTRISKEDKAYFFVLHKGKSIAKSAPKSSDMDTYIWYQVKDKYDTDKSGSLSKDEKATLYANVHDYLISLGYSNTQATNAQKWTYK